MNTLHEPRISRARRLIEAGYRDNPTGYGASFGELLCHELHSNGLTFVELANKWSISLPTLGELIWDHCCRMEGDPKIKRN